jgi:hypothetical protein
MECSNSLRIHEKLLRRVSGYLASSNTEANARYTQELFMTSQLFHDSSSHVPKYVVWMDTIILWAVLP